MSRHHTRFYLPIVISLAVSLVGAIALGQSLFSKAPKLSKLEWISEPGEDRAEIRIIYAWATWCSPCRMASKTLADFSAEHPGRLSVVAISHEDRNVLEDFLTPEYRVKRPFKFARMSPANFKSGTFTRKVRYFPYAQVVYRDKLVWEGNPTHPLGEFESLLDALLANEFDTEAEKKFRSKVATHLVRVEKRRQEIASSVQDLNRAVESYKSALKKARRLQTADYTLSRDLRGALLLRNSLELFISSERDHEQISASFKDEMKSSYNDTLWSFADSKDDLAFLASEIFTATEAPLDDEFILLARRAVNESAALDLDGNYPDLLGLLEARALAEDGLWHASLNRVNQALALARSLKRPPSYRDFFVSDQQRYKEKLSLECSNFTTCLLRALRLLKVN